IEKGVVQNNCGIGARISRHAGVWDDQTSQYNTVVRQNSIVVWDPWKGGTRSRGHVAFVEKVYADGSFLISESNWDSARMSFNVRHIKPGTNAFDSAKFIYL
ncbi:MAG: CHAP domain-containing protein, partial [Rivularia sp. ALOHA_DT_140]|nr:CHAP domain-containing protein [Rivularia sp. ALOHA_DT_140]